MLPEECGSHASTSPSSPPPANLIDDASLCGITEFLFALSATTGTDRRRHHRRPRRRRASLGIPVSNRHDPTIDPNRPASDH